MTIFVEGIKETQTMLNNIMNQNSSNKQALLQEVADLLSKTAQTNAHVITGNMKANISVSSVSDKQATVTASANYSAYENARSGTKFGSGTHDFMDRAVTSTIKEVPGICAKYVSKWASAGGKK